MTYEDFFDSENAGDNSNKYVAEVKIYKKCAVQKVAKLLVVF